MVIAVIDSHSPVGENVNPYLNVSPMAFPARLTPRFLRWGGAIALAGLGCLLPVLSSSTSVEAKPAKLEPLDCPFERPKRGMQAQCYYLEVPEDHFDPSNARTLKIAIAVVRAGSTQPDPIVYLEGGPGVGPVDSTPAIADELIANNPVKRDLIVIDQRGTGLSQPRLNCPEVSDFARAKLNEVESDRAYMGRFFESLQACTRRLRQSGANLAVFHSAQSAADVVAVGKALGYPKINLFGASYGARLALTLLRDFGETGYIRSASIGAVYAPDSKATDLGASAIAALERVFVECTADTACNEAFPNLRQVFYETVEQLNAQPARSQLLDFQTGELLTARSDGTVFFDTIFFRLFHRRGIATVPAYIYATYRGDRGLLEPTLTLFDLYDWGMNAATQCYEEFPLIAPEDVAASQAQIPPALGSWYLRNPESSPLLVDFCATLGLPNPPTTEDLPVTSTVPTLVISGAFDPLTPPSMAEQAIQNLSRAYAYVLPHAGHDSIMTDGCAREMTYAFIANPLQAPDSGCLEALTIEFDTQIYQ